MRRIVLVILCLLTGLHCLHGYEYARCRCIFPDEIMDLQANMTSVFSRIEQGLSLEERDEETFFNLSEMSVSRTWIAFNLRRAFPLNFYNAFETKNRLFTLQHYNS